MNYAILLCGGTGTRLGANVPKQYLEVNGKMIFQYALDVLSESTSVDGYIIVAEAYWRDAIQERLEYQKSHEVNKMRFLGFADPGENRQLSILHALRELQSVVSSEDVVLIQDAARPNTKTGLIRACLETAKVHDGAIPVLPMKDTVYLSANGTCVSQLLDRDTVFAGQAPEAFRFGKYLQANEDLLPERILKINGSTEPAVMAGMDVAFVPGDEENYKITTVSDLKRFEKEMQ